ncbi:MAG: hypothetical protein ACKOE6_13885 [Flammeovirgaceae bacterium]
MKRKLKNLSVERTSDFVGVTYRLSPEQQPRVGIFLFSEEAI